MTNLIAAVVISIITNVTTASNESGCKICSAAGPGFTPAVYHSGGFRACDPYRPATERTETTTVVEIKTLRFVWEGKAYTAKEERVLSSKVRRWTLKNEWVESE
jgi:hypothetical protein